MKQIAFLLLSTLLFISGCGTKEPITVEELQNVVFTGKVKLLKEKFGEPDKVINNKKHIWTYNIPVKRGNFTSSSFDVYIRSVGDGVITGYSLLDNKTREKLAKVKYTPDQISEKGRNKSISEIISIFGEPHKVHETFGKIWFEYAANIEGNEKNIKFVIVFKNNKEHGISYSTLDIN